jgi:hypothetical protein
VENQKYLGIYITRGKATAVCVSAHGHEYKVSAFFSVVPEIKEGQTSVTIQDVVEVLAKTCSEKLGSVKEIPTVVALDCALYMQHNVHSEFRDSKQILQTIRYDTEEAVAADIADLAIAFEVTSSDEKGSDISVYTAQKQVLSDILLTLQANGIEPIVIEPDINSLSHYITNVISNPNLPKEGTLFGFLSNTNGYFTFFTDSAQQMVKRTFIINKSQNHQQLIQREIPFTLAALKGGASIARIRILDSSSPIDINQLSGMYGIDSALIDITVAAETDQQPIQEIDLVDYSVAYGAALANIQKQVVNFRDDYLPYLGKKKRIEKAVKFSGIALFVLVVILGVISQYILFVKDTPRKKLREKFTNEYFAVMMTKKMPDTPVKKLEKELKRIEMLRSGSGDESVSGKLALILDALNKCASQTNLNIETISIGEKEIRIVGDTSNRQNTLKFFEAIKKNKLEILQQRLDTKGDRDVFTINIQIKKA